MVHDGGVARHRRAVARVVRAGWSMIWTLLGALVLAAGVRHVLRLRAARQAEARALSDAEMLEIERTGRLAERDPADDAPLDLDEIAAAEEAFWDEEWDEPEEYER